MGTDRSTPRDAHIIINTNSRPPVFECRGCGLQRPLELPCSITLVVKSSKVFIKEHLQCADPRFVRACTVCVEKGLKSAATYVATGEQGEQWYECDNHGPNEYKYPRKNCRALPKALFSPF